MLKLNLSLFFTDCLGLTLHFSMYIQFFFQIKATTVIGLARPYGLADL